MDLATPARRQKPSLRVERPIACIASSDQIYADRAESTAQALKAAGARHVLLAGRPGNRESALRAAGVDGFVYAGCDMVEALGSLQSVLGVTT